MKIHDYTTPSAKPRLVGAVHFDNWPFEQQRVTLASDVKFWDGESLLDEGDYGLWVGVTLAELSDGTFVVIDNEADLDTFTAVYA